jgi:hypothetical protein
MKAKNRGWDGHPYHPLIETLSVVIPEIIFKTRREIEKYLPDFAIMVSDITFNLDESPLTNIGL